MSFPPSGSRRYLHQQSIKIVILALLTDTKHSSTPRTFRHSCEGVVVRQNEGIHSSFSSSYSTFNVPQEENEIPASVYVKDPPPFPRDEILEEGEESAPGTDASQVQEGDLHTIQLSSDEDVGLEAELEEDDIPLQDLENMEKSRAEKLKLSSLKKVRSSVSRMVQMGQMVQRSNTASVSRWTV